MSELPDPGPGWRLAGGDDWRDERCEWWCTTRESWVPRLTPKCSLSKHDIYRIPIDLPQPDLVNAPPHYRQGEIECIDAIRAALTDEEFRGFIKGNAIKYCWREKHKGGDQDLAKAKWYLDRLSKEQGK